MAVTGVVVDIIIMDENITIRDITMEMVTAVIKKSLYT